MAQIIGDKLLMFHAAVVDANSVANADDGTDLDLAAFPATNVTAIAAENNGNGLVYIYFKNGTKYEEGSITGDNGTSVEMAEQAFVRLTCTSGKEASVIEDLWILLNSVSASPVIKFDVVNSVFPIENVSGVQIRRHITTNTVASDTP